MKGKYISAERLKETLEKVEIKLEKNSRYNMSECEDAIIRFIRNDLPFIIDGEPAVNTPPVIYAHYKNGYCTQCGAGMPTEVLDDCVSESDISRCWNCGAIMDEEE